MDWKKYKALSFDIYATLIDWETGIIEALQPLIRQVKKPSSEDVLSRQTLLRAYTKHEHAQESAHPKLAYPSILALVYKELASDLSIVVTEEEANAFGQSIGAWPAFSDTLDAMRELAKYYHLIVLSNVNLASFSKTLEGPLLGVVSTITFWNIIHSF